MRTISRISLYGQCSGHKIRILHLAQHMNNLSGRFNLALSIVRRGSLKEVTGRGKVSKYSPCNIVVRGSNKSRGPSLNMRTRVERHGDRIVIVYELEDFEKDIVELVELLKARRYRGPIRIVIETGLC